MNDTNNTNRTATLISTSACTSVYNVNGKAIRVWIIVGGTPAISFDLSPYVQRFPIIEKWDKWNKEINRYEHQISQNKVIGPTPDEAFPNGWADFWAYYDKFLPKVQLDELRYNGLPIKKIVSKGKRDKENHTIVRAEIDFHPYFIPPVTFSSGCYWGRCDNVISFFSEWWKSMQALLNPIFDNNGGTTWSDLSEEKYKEIVTMLEKYDEDYKEIVKRF